jgi:hypothetical protein
MCSSLRRVWVIDSSKVGDTLTFDGAGLVREFTVIVRPYSAATALREAMAARLASAE